MKKILMAVAVMAALAACSGKENVSFNTLETARNQARENSLFNAQNYRKDNTKYASYSIVPNGDSTQMPDCPQGDGWATLKLISQDKNHTMGLKCSTVSGAVGCLEDAEFKTKPYAGQDGRCQPTTVVPHPLPKIAQ